MYKRQLNPRDSIIAINDVGVWGKTVEDIVVAFNQAPPAHLVEGVVVDPSFRRVVLEVREAGLEADDLLEGLDVRNTGDIEWHEFLAATMEKKLYDKHSHVLDNAFSHFDTDGSGFITVRCCCCC